METQLPICPSCDSKQVVKNGKIHNGKQNYRCKNCSRQFVENPQQKRISDATKALINDLLLERISLAGIARVAKVSEPWLQHYVNEKYAQVPRQTRPRSQKKDD